jgi:hypothetical protein
MDSDKKSVYWLKWRLVLEIYKKLESILDVKFICFNELHKMFFLLFLFCVPDHKLRASGSHIYRNLFTAWKTFKKCSVRWYRALNKLLSQNLMVLIGSVHRNVAGNLEIILRQQLKWACLGFNGSKEHQMYITIRCKNVTSLHDKNTCACI